MVCFYDVAPWQPNRQDVVLVNLTKTLVNLWYLKLARDKDFDARVNLVTDSTSLEKLKKNWLLGLE